MANITSGAGSTKLTIGATSNGAFCEVVDNTQNKLANLNRAAVTEVAAGLMNSGKDYKVARTIRVSSTGTVHMAGDQTAMLADSYEGTVRNLNQWIETLTTMTTAQAVATGLTLNNGAITTINTGALESSHKQFPVFARTCLVFRTRLRNTGVNNQTTEFGFSDCSSATTVQITNGVYFRKDASGNLQGVWSFNGSDVVSTSVLTQPATTDYVTYEIFLEDSRATFQIWTSAGALVASATLEIPATTARQFGVTHIPCFHRIYNAGSAPASGGQLIINLTTVQMVDAWSQRPLSVQQSGMGLNGLTSPTAYTQLANWGNSAAPTTRTLSNTAAAEATLGGLLRANSIAGGNTDLIMFGWQNPSPYMFYCDGIWIPPPMNEVVAVATTATIFTYFAAANSSAVSLATAAPYSPMRVALPGIHTAAVGLAANALFSGAQIAVQFTTPIAVFPGRFLHIGCRELVGTATATETYLWAGVGISGFFE